MVTLESYERDAQRMLAAAKAWRADNPGTELVFHPLGYPGGTSVLAGLVPELIRRVGGSHKTRELLRTMDAATNGEGTVAQAEACLEIVFGLKRAISGESHSTKAVTAIPCPQCGANLNSRGTLDVAKPRAREFCVCGHCAAVLRFDTTLTPRPATPAERATLPPEVLGMVQIIAAKANTTKPS
jgi:hypothetical protein